MCQPAIVSSFVLPTNILWFVDQPVSCGLAGWVPPGAMAVQVPGMLLLGFSVDTNLRLSGRKAGNEHGKCGVVS